jgi:hypothetical protein
VQSQSLWFYQHNDIWCSEQRLNRIHWYLINLSGIRKKFISVNSTHVEFQFNNSVPPLRIHTILGNQQRSILWNINMLWIYVRVVGAYIKHCALGSECTRTSCKHPTNGGALILHASCTGKKHDRNWESHHVTWNMLLIGQSHDHSQTAKYKAMCSVTRAS